MSRKLLAAVAALVTIPIAAAIFLTDRGQSVDGAESIFTDPDYEQVVPRDAINAIHDPLLISVDRPGVDLSEMVMAVEFNGESRAYSITLLNRREMVNDVVGGIPILVTW